MRGLVPLHRAQRRRQAPVRKRRSRQKRGTFLSTPAARLQLSVCRRRRRQWVRQQGKHSGRRRRRRQMLRRKTCYLMLCCSQKRPVGMHPVQREHSPPSQQTRQQLRPAMLLRLYLHSPCQRPQQPSMHRSSLQLPPLRCKQGTRRLHSRQQLPAQALLCLATAAPLRQAAPLPALPLHALLHRPHAAATQPPLAMLPPAKTASAVALPLAAAKAAAGAATAAWAAAETKTQRHWMR